MRKAAIYGLCVVVLAALGFGARWGLAERREEAVVTASHVAEVEALLARMPASGGRTDGTAIGDNPSGSIGAAVEAAAKRSGLGPASVHEVKPANAAEGTEGLLTVYRVRLVGVRPQGLVKFVYLLESEGRLRTTELSLDRQSLRNPDWDVSLLVVRAL